VATNVLYLAISCLDMRCRQAQPGLIRFHFLLQQKGFWVPDRRLSSGSKELKDGGVKDEVDTRIRQDV